MSYLLDLAQKLEDDGVGTTIGREKNIFISTVPEIASRAILLQDNELGTPIDHEIDTFYKTEFEVTVREKDYVSGEEKSLAVSESLNVLQSTIGSLFVYYVRPRHLPLSFPVSSGDYVEWLITFDICFRTT